MDNKGFLNRVQALFAILVPIQEQNVANLKFNTFRRRKVLLIIDNSPETTLFHSYNYN